MGHCSSIDVPIKEKLGRRQSVQLSAELVGLNSENAFKEQFSDKGPANKKKELILVKHKVTGGTYICRLVEKACAPCQQQDNAVLCEHLQKLNGLEHPHICKFVEAFEVGDCYYLLYEKASSTTLFHHIQAGKTFCEDDAAEYTRQLCMALAVAHDQEVYHGRLSPSSVILSPTHPDSESDDDEEPLPAQAKICDMGQTYIFRDSVSQQWKQLKESSGGSSGSTEEPRKEIVAYMPPEAFWDDGPLGERGEVPIGAAKLDIWALGCIVYHMLTGMPPHRAVSNDALVDRIRTCSVDYGEDWRDLSPESRDWVDSVLKVNAGFRPNAGQLLRHGWLRLQRERIAKGRMLRIINNIKENAREGQFKRMVMRVVASQLPKDMSDLVHIERAYRVFDKNGDGILGVQEICTALETMKILSDKELKAFEVTLEQLDRDGSKTVNLQEFIAGALNSKRTLSYANLWGAFRAFDKDGSGGVSVDEIEQIIRQVEAGLLAKEQVDGLVQCVRSEIRIATYKEHIDFEQFVYIMSTATGKPNRGLAMRRDTYRGCHSLCGVDCYHVRHVKPKEFLWVYDPRSPSSVYRRAGIVAGRRHRGNAPETPAPPAPHKLQPKQGQQQPKQGGQRRTSVKQR